MSPEMEKYTAELRESKEALEELEPEEREERIEKLQRRYLSDEDRRPMFLPAPQAAPDFVRLQQIYLAEYSKLERELEKLSPEERSERLVELKTRIVGSP